MASDLADHAVTDIKELELGLRQTYKELEMQNTFLKSNLIDIKQSDIDPKVVPQIVKELEKTLEMCEECHQVTGQMVKKIAESLEYLKSVIPSVNMRFIGGRKCDSGISSMGTNPGSRAVSDLSISTTDSMVDTLVERRDSDPDITKQEESPANDTKDIVRQFSDSSNGSERTTSGELESEEDNTKVSPETEDIRIVSQKIRNDNGDHQSDDSRVCSLNIVSAALPETSAPAHDIDDVCVPILPPVLDESQTQTTGATGFNKDAAPRESVVFATSFEDQREFLETQAAETHLRRTQVAKHGHRHAHGNIDS